MLELQAGERIKSYILLLCILMISGCEIVSKKPDLNDIPARTSDESEIASQQKDMANEQKYLPRISVSPKRTTIENASEGFAPIGFDGDKFYYLHDNSLVELDLETRKKRVLELEGFKASLPGDRSRIDFARYIVLGLSLMPANGKEDQSKIACVDLFEMKIVWEVENPGNLILRYNANDVLIICFNDVMRFVDCSSGFFKDIKGKRLSGFGSDVWFKDRDGYLMSVVYLEKDQYVSNFHPRFIERRDNSFNLIWSIQNGSPGGDSLGISDTFRSTKYQDRFYAKRCFEELQEVTCFGYDGKEIWTICTSFCMEVFDEQNSLLISQVEKNEIGDRDWNVAVCAYSLYDGKLVWESEPIRNRAYGILETTTETTKDHIYVCSTYEILKLDKANGKTAWKIDNENGMLKNLRNFKIASYCNPSKILEFSCEPIPEENSENQINDLMYFSVDSQTGKIIKPLPSKAELDELTTKAQRQGYKLISVSDVTNELAITDVLGNAKHVIHCDNEIVLYDPETGKKLGGFGISNEQPEIEDIYGVVCNGGKLSHGYVFQENGAALRLLVKTNASVGNKVELWEIGR